MTQVRLTLLLMACLAGGTLVRADDDVDFREQVEPLLKKRCYACHSHAGGRMKSGLTLDWRSGWERGGTRGRAIVPGDPDASLLIRAIRHTDDDLQMPAEKLPEAEIALLVRWVRQGAVDPRTAEPAVTDAADWWSLRPLNRPPVPAVDGAAQPVDAFLQDRLRSEQLTPSPEADRRTLIRRLTYDLHGLLPTWEETQAFVHDPNPRAYEDLVERLLASPRYGERWARHWFDTIHFADSHGFEHDVFRPHAWRFRDYVIERFNQDVAWPQFIREQIAADVYLRDSPSAVVALGFLGAGTYDHSAAVTAPMSFENLDRDDLVTQVTAAFVSTTANCARCHDHKFDPISQDDYYALQAVFAGIGKGNIAFDADPQVAAARTRWETLRNATEPADANVLLTPVHQELVETWERQLPQSVRWHVLPAEEFLSAGGAELRRLEDGSILSGGTAPEKETLTVTTHSSLPQVTAVRLDVLTDESLPQRGPGRAVNGNLHLTELEVRLLKPGETNPVTLKIRRATADFDQAGWTIQHAIDGNPATAWGIHPQEGASHQAVFELESPVTLEPGAKLVVVLHQDHGRSHVIGRLLLSATDGPPEQAVALPKQISDVVGIPRAQRTAEQQLALSAAVLRRVADDELRRLPPRALVYAAAASAENERGVVRLAEPRNIRVLNRGNVEQPGAEVTPGALAAVGAIPARWDLPANAPESVRRNMLAEWLTDRRNPLTWRSIANRVWHYHFGRGLCDTPSDFGRMGGKPSHPELLDWLACEVRDGSGSLKELHRLICSSAAYRQSSAPRNDLAARDPDNRLLARMSRSRLDADGFRDGVLAASGRLDPQMTGPGISHFSSRPGAQLTPILDYNDFNWDSPGATRRSIYRVVWRGIPDPVFEVLDFPDLGLLAPTRGFSASPLQSLVLLNNRFVLHHARHMAQRALAQGGDVRSQVQWLVRWSWQREPSAEESDLLAGLANRQGLAAVSRLLLNSNEFLFVD